MSDTPTKQYVIPSEGSTLRIKAGTLITMIGTCVGGAIWLTVLRADLVQALADIADLKKVCDRMERKIDELNSSVPHGKVSFNHPILQDATP